MSTWNPNWSHHFVCQRLKRCSYNCLEDSLEYNSLVRPATTSSDVQNSLNKLMVASDLNYLCSCTTWRWPRRFYRKSKWLLQRNGKTARRRTRTFLLSEVDTWLAKLWTCTHAEYRHAVGTQWHMDPTDSVELCAYSHVTSTAIPHSFHLSASVTARGLYRGMPYTAVAKKEKKKSRLEKLYFKQKPHNLSPFVFHLIFAASFFPVWFSLCYCRSLPHNIKRFEAVIWHYTKKNLNWVDFFCFSTRFPVPATYNTP